MSFEDELLKAAIGEPETDGRVYELHASPAMKICDRLDAEGKIAFEVCEPEVVAAMPPLEPMSGTYLDVSRRAQHLNRAQQIAGFKAMIFYPHPAQPTGAR